MPISDSLGDMLTRIRNAQLRMKTSVPMPFSRFLTSVLDVLQEKGFIRGYRVSLTEAGFREILIELKYHNGSPAIKFLKRVSKPGRRVYTSKQIQKTRNGLGVSIISTSQGVMSDSEASLRGLGGEFLCQIA